jgi:hypothetical protein
LKLATQSLTTHLDVELAKEFRRIYVINAISTTLNKFLLRFVRPSAVIPPLQPMSVFRAVQAI